MTETPEFEKTEDGHIFNQGDEIYYIDKNDYDIYLATIQQKSENGYLIKFQNIDSKPKEVDLSRILLKSAVNDSIYEKQEELRNKQDEDEIKEKSKKKHEKDIDKDISHEKKHKKSKKSNNDDNDHTRVIKKKNKVKRVKKHKAPIIDNKYIIRNAWQNGIQSPDQFKTFIKKKVKSLCEEYNQYYKIMNENDDNPLFSLGGYDDDKKSDQKIIKKFWEKSHSIWHKLFNDSISVRTSEFNKKLAELIKLPNQTESNAKSAIEFFFNPDEVNEVSFPSFCAFMSLFAPYKSAIRKIRDFINISNKFGDNIIIADPIDVVEQDLETEANRIDIEFDKNRSFYVYNLPQVQYGEEYLIDGDKNLYKTWEDFFEKIQNISTHESTKSSSTSSSDNQKDDDSNGEELKETKEDNIMNIQISSSDDNEKI